jgi:acetolactate synthase-1/2/3 large subunit
MNNAETIVKILAHYGALRCFSMVGGHSLYLNDAFHRNEEINVTYIHNEQAASMAADSYFRIHGRIPIVNVAAAPAALNCLNGVYGAFVDSIPMVVVSGGPKLSQSVRTTGLDLRQYGDQEFDAIVDVVKPICKKVIQLNHLSNIDYEVRDIIEIATGGRPGPVWIDVPMDVQGAPYKDVPYDQSRIEEIRVMNRQYKKNKPSIKQIELVVAALNSAKRPVLYLGDQIRTYSAENEVNNLITSLGIPVVTEWNAHDLIESDSDYFVGRPGLRGERSGNFVTYASDVVLGVGTKFSSRQVGAAVNSFAPNAMKVMVENDFIEMYKPNLHIDLPIHSSPKTFCEMLLDAVENTNYDKNRHREWLDRSKTVYCKWRPKKEDYRVTDKLNPYHFLFDFFKHVPTDVTIVLGNGISVVGAFQTAFVKKGQRLYQNVGCASMGYDLPAAIGAAINSSNKVICLTGDGSIQLNVQELETIKQHELNVSIVVFNNNGYHSIKQSQVSLFGKSVNLHGITPQSGLSFPNLKKLSAAYGFDYQSITQKTASKFDWGKFLKNHLNLLEVFVSDEQNFEPKVGFTIDDDGRISGGSLINMLPMQENDTVESVISFLMHER